MKWLTPRSLFAQIALVMTLALLAASTVNFAMIWSERSRAGLIEVSGPAMARFVDLAVDVAANPPPPERGSQFGRGGARFSITPVSAVEFRALPRSSRLESRLVAAFEQAGALPPDIRAADTRVERPDRPRFGGPGGPGGFERGGRPSPMMQDGPRARDGVIRGREIVLAALLPDGRWLNGAFFTPEPPRGETLRLAAATFILFAAVLAASLWIAARLSRPLHDLAAAAARVGSEVEPQAVAVRGPTDVKQTLEAFNAMSRRVSQLLNEKDVMLGALGHDLRTPLASLRIRIESMEPPAERQKAVRTIEETASLLDDILELARRGRSSEPVQKMDLSVLVDDVVEDYAETGAAVTLVSREKAPLACRPVLLRRMLRNLIDNALAYGHAARVSVEATASGAVIHIDDDGPGMSDAELATATQPFVRGDGSRSRGTGGAGLGLALSDAIARTHGGSLTLANRQQGGLRVSVVLPSAV